MRGEARVWAWGLLAAAALVCAGCTSAPVYRARDGHASERAMYEGIPLGRTYQVGVASYYAAEFHGKRTASGEVFDMNAMTAAHNELPFGTVIRVTHLGNGNSVVVRINDRGPSVKGRILDLSYAAAKELDMIREGNAKVHIEVLRGGG